MRVVVFVPGIMGSVLETPEGDKVWPPSLKDVVFGYGDIDDLLREDLLAIEPIKRVAIFYSIYGCILDDIEACGYTPNGNNRKFVSFPYDWRKSNIDTAHKLAETLDQLDVGDEDEIILIGHSMGGLILRYLIETPHFETRAWFQRISQLITLGTPHHGAASALKQCVGKVNNAGISKENIKILANDKRYPSAFQLIPPAKNAQMIEDSLPSDVPNTFNSLDASLVASFGLSADNVESYKTFWGDMEQGIKREHVDYIYFVGSSYKTHYRNDWNGVDDFSVREAKSSGDGTVAISSAIDPNVPHAFSQKKHSKIFEDRGLRVALYKILDAPSGVRPFSAEGNIEVNHEDAIGVSVDKDVYQTSEPIEIVVSFVTPRNDPSIRLQFVKINIDSGEVLEWVEPVIEVEFEGTKVKDVSFEVEYELEPHLYKLVPIGFESDDPEINSFIVEHSVDS